MDYKIIKYCRLCKKKFFVKRGEAKKAYCEECFRKMFVNKKSSETEKKQ